MGTFLWRSKEKYLARRGETRHQDSNSRPHPNPLPTTLSKRERESIQMNLNRSNGHHLTRVPSQAAPTINTPAKPTGQVNARPLTHSSRDVDSSGVR